MSPGPRFGPAFAKVLVRLLDRKGLTAEQLAKRSKVPLRRIRQYLRGGALSVCSGHSCRKWARKYQ
jgi:transcriptional regulator with XRE-family HTH domain